MHIVSKKFAIVVLLGIIIIMIIPDASLANSVNEEQKPENLADVLNGQSETMQTISSWASLLVSIFTPLVAVLLKLISSLMTDSFIFGDNSSGGSNIAQLLYEVWNISRSIVNYLLLVLVMFAALMGLIPKFGESYDLNKNIGKIIIAAILVNLTWFGVRVVMDASAIATHAVYALPQSIMVANKTFEDAMDPSKNPCIIEPVTADNKVTQKGQCQPVYTIINPKGSFTKIENIEVGVQSEKEKAIQQIDEQIKTLQNKKTAENATITESNINILQKQKEDIQKIDNSKIVNYGAVTIFWSDFNYERFNAGSIAPLFAYSIMQIQKLPMIAIEATNVSKMLQAQTDIIESGWVSLLINSVIALIVMIMLIVIFVMMIIVLAFRVVIIWINIMVLPFWAFSTIGIWSSIFKKLEGSYIGIGPLINSIFAPAIMGLPMVVGFILIQTGTQMHIFPSLDKGALLEGPLINGVSNFHQAFYYILCIAVMWIGSKAAISSVSKGTFFEGWISSISKGVDGLIKGVASAPMYIQFAPVVGSDGKIAAASIANLFGENGLGRVETYFQNESMQNDPFAAATKDDTLKNATTNSQVFSAMLFNDDKKADVLKEVDNKKDALKDLYKSRTTEMEIKNKLNNLDVPSLRNAINNNTITLEALWKHLFHGDKPKNTDLNAAYREIIPTTTAPASTSTGATAPAGSSDPATTDPERTSTGEAATERTSDPATTTTNSTRR